MSEFFQRLENTVATRRLLARGQKILVAVSGGADSMVLLHALHSLAKENRWSISVVHFNHHLRGRASDADETLVRQTSAKLRLKFFAGGADVKRLAAQSKISVEMAARKLRHEFLARTAREQNIPTIALAHHAGDQVELFLLRLLRGAGGEGVAGMKWRSPSPVDPTISLIRPFLDVSKADLLAFAQKNKIQFRNDATNFSTDFLRNRIRNELLPLLRKQYQPAVDKTVLRLMDIIGTEAEFVGEAARAWKRRHLAGEFHSRRARKTSADTDDDFANLPPAMQRMVLRQQLTHFGLLPDFDLVEQLRTAPEKPVTVSPGLSVMRNSGGKVLCRELPVAKFNAAELKLNLRGKALRSDFGGHRFQWQIQALKNFRLPLKRTGKMPTTKQREYFDADKVGGQIILRHWQPGDRFQPIGMKAPVKLQDLFVNAKIPAARRRNLVLAATAAGEIFWVQGLRIGENVKLVPNTRRRLAWQWAIAGAAACGTDRWR